MKTLLFTSLLLVSFSSMANKNEKMGKEWKKKWESMSFEDAKKMKSEMLTKKKSMIEEEQGCVDKSTDKKMLNGCMDKARSEMEAMYKDMDKKMKM